MAKKNKRMKVKKVALKVKGNGFKRKTKMQVLKEWLEDNKIIFETLMTTTLTIMGIWVSIVSSHYEKAAFGIQEAQALVEEQLNMPVFNLYRKYNSEENEDGTSIRKSTDIQITNTGGNITNGYLSARPVIEVVMYDEFYNRNTLILLELWGMYEKSFSYYDPENSKFEITEVYTDFYSWELVSYLEEKLKEDFPDFQFYVFYSENINITYKDFKGAHHDEWYYMGGGGLFFRTALEAEERRFVLLENETKDDIYGKVNEFLLGYLSERDSASFDLKEE